MTKISPPDPRDAERVREQRDVLVIGAGVAGIACARALADAGVSVVVMDKARGVGGRCATRRIEGQPVDHGLGFFHGRDPAFLAAVRSLGPDAVVEGWPRAIHGNGTPCQPDAFESGQSRLALRAGATAWPKALAAGLDIRLAQRVNALVAGRGEVVAIAEDGDTIAAATLVLALPVEQAQALLATLADPGRELRSVAALLGMIRSSPCLALAALWTPERMPAPAWDMALPTDGCIQVISHDSSKRVAPVHRAFVIQATPAWSRRHLEQPPSAWTPALLAAAATHLGQAAHTPDALHPHRWRYARISRSDELASPVLCPVPGGGEIGLAGEAFARGAGAEAAYISGTRLASRLLDRRAAQRGAHA